MCLTSVVLRTKYGGRVVTRYGPGQINTIVMCLFMVLHVSGRITDIRRRGVHGSGRVDGGKGVH